jgi:hypothetical protein
MLTKAREISHQVSRWWSADERRCRLLSEIKWLYATFSTESCDPVSFNSKVTMFEKSRPYRPLLGDGEDQSDTDESIIANAGRSRRGFWLWRLVPAIHSLVTAILLFVVIFGVYREKSSFHSRCVKELHTPCKLHEPWMAKI